MFKSVGEASPFSEDRDDYGYAVETHRNSALSGNNDRHNNHHHHEGVDDDDYNPFNQPSPPQLDSDDNTEQPMSWKKMHWHASRIDKVQDLVPEQVRWFYKEDPKTKWLAFIGYDSLRIECRFRALEYARLRSNSLEEEEVDTRIHVRGGLYEVDINNGVVHPVYWKGASLPILRGTWFVDGTGQPLEYEYSQQLEQDHLAKFMGQDIPDEHPEERKTKSEVLHNVKFREFHVDWYDVNEVYMFSEAASSRMFRYVTNKLSIQKPGTGTRLYRGYFDEAKMDDKPADVTHLVFVVHGIGQKYNQNRIISCCNHLRNGTEKLIPKYFPDLINTSTTRRIEFLPVEWRTDLQLDGDLVESITPDKLKGLRLILNSTAMDIMYYTSPLYRGEIIEGLSSELNRLYAMFVERHPYFEANNGQVSICAHSLGSVIMYDILTGWDPIELYDQYVCNVVREHSKTDGKSEIAAMTNTQRSKKLHDFYISSIVQKESSPLSFKVANVFSLGSPLGVFLTLRGMRPKPNGLMDHLLPKSLCKRFYNIYHPSDPVAYRIEPLVLKHYSTIAPLKIHKIHDNKKTPYSEMKAKAYAAFSAKKVKKPKKVKSPARPEISSMYRDEDAGSLTGSSHTISSDGTPISPQSTTGSSTRTANGGSPKINKQTPADNANTRGGLTGAVKGFFSRFGGHTVKAQEKLASELDEYETTDEETDDVKSDDGGDAIEHTDLEYRLDYVLPMGSMTNSYVSAIFSHTSYWASPEVALFILSHVFPDYGPVR